MLPNQRGRYSYAVEILNADGTVLDTARMLGSLRITEETAPLVVENFTVEDGYKDKVILRWNQYVNVGYFVETSQDSRKWENKQQIDVLTQNELPAGEQFKPYSYTLTQGVSAGQSYYIRVTPFKEAANTQKPGIETISAPVTLLGVPELETAADYQYDHISLKWKQVPKADSYRIIYQYTNTDPIPQTELTDPTQPDQKYTSGAQMQTALIPASELNADSKGTITYKFKPAGYDDARFAGRELSIKLQAINTERCADPSAPDIQTDSSAIAESTAEQSRKQMGPAMTGLTASHAEYGDKIELKWNKVDGAAGYLIYRIQKDLAGSQTQSEEPLTFYYDAASNTVKGLQLKNEGGTWADSPLSEDAETGTITIKAHDTYYAIQDLYKNETWHTENKTVYKEQFADEQYEMAIGYPYTYLVLPVISSSDTAEIDFSLGICTLSGAVWNNAAAVMQTGYTLGLPEKEKIRGSKGWGATEKNGTYESTHVTITWTPPKQKPENTEIRYRIWRTPQGQNTWKNISGDEHITAVSWDDTSAEPGIVYEYAVSTWTATAQSIEPASHPLYLTSISTVYDEEAQGMFNNTGYKLGRPVIDVSRDEQKHEEVYAEKITWSAGGNEKLNTEGYLIEVRNNNIDDQWHAVKDIAAEKVKTTNESYVTAADAAMDGIENILKVLRDYKHYYRIRAYITRDGEKIYSEMPVEWSEGIDTDNMTWGARQITAEEFCRAANLVISDGLYLVNDTSWNTASKGTILGIPYDHTRTKNPTEPGSGEIYAESDFNVKNWMIQYTDYRPAFISKAGATHTFLSVSGVFNPKTDAVLQYPQSYNSDTSEPLTVTGPADTTLYSGSISYKNFTQQNGYMLVTYNNQTIEIVHDNYLNSPLPFSGGGGYKNDTDEWR